MPAVKIILFYYDVIAKLVKCRILVPQIPGQYPPQKLVSTVEFKLFSRIVETATFNIRKRTIY